jgi:hypothetical protein
MSGEGSLEVAAVDKLAAVYKLKRVKRDHGRRKLLEVFELAMAFVKDTSGGSSRTHCL